VKKNVASLGNSKVIELESNPITRIDATTAISTAAMPWVGYLFARLFIRNVNRYS
jgi:hypothetical protein